jgi:hypothetical protein
MPSKCIAVEFMYTITLPGLAEKPDEPEKHERLEKQSASGIGTRSVGEKEALQFRRLENFKI